MACDKFFSDRLRYVDFVEGEKWLSQGFPLTKPMAVNTGLARVRRLWYTAKVSTCISSHFETLAINVQSANLFGWISVKCRKVNQRKHRLTHLHSKIMTETWQKCQATNSERHILYAYKYNGSGLVNHTFWQGIHIHVRIEASYRYPCFR